jgi:hypothetical protein
MLSKATAKWQDEGTQTECVLARTFVQQSDVGSSDALCKYLTSFLSRCSLFDMSAYIKNICFIYVHLMQVTN